jgi:RNA polymerase subunit RPABC4/transcription elongation factor Spt4
VRPPETLDDVHERETEIAAREAELQVNGAVCPNCLKPVERDFLVCPTCLKKLKKPCDSCGRPIKLTWSVCPYCKAKQTPGEAAASVPQPEKPTWSASDPLAEALAVTEAKAKAKAKAKAEPAAEPEPAPAFSDMELSNDEIQ